MRGLRVTASADLEAWMGQALRQRRVVVPSLAALARVAAFAGASQNLVHVSVPAAVDQVERVLLDVATQLGGAVASQVDAALREEGEEPRGALAVLSAALGRRPLLVENAERFGAFGGDLELATALSSRARTVKEWLSEAHELVVGAGSTWPAAPLTLANGAAANLAAVNDSASGRPETFELLVSYHAALGQPPAEVIDPELAQDDDSLRERIIEHLAPGMRRAHTLLAVHGRAFPDALAERLGLVSAFDRLKRVGLVHRVRDAVRIDRGWFLWWRARLSERRRLDLHREIASQLAEMFLPDGPDAGRTGLLRLEAHRHYAAAGEFSQALELARYGVHVLVAAARRVSMDGHFDDAARMYAQLIETSVPMPQRLRAYVRHYLHYNRAHAKLEPIARTAEGYEHSLREWGENALFWSRRVRAAFYMDRRTEALRLLADAWQKVPEHPEKGTILVARTARGLLARGRVEDAVAVWGKYEPDSAAAEEVFDYLVSVLAAGFATSQLLSGERPTLFLRERRVVIEHVPRGWVAELPDLELRSNIEDSAARALSSLVNRLRGEARALLGAFSHVLEPAEVKRKATVLGALDVVASELEPVERETAWVMGSLVTKANRLWLTTGGDSECWFEVTTDALHDRNPEPGPWLAEVRCSRSIPRGPVVNLVPATSRDPAELWRAWAARQGDGG